MTEKPILFSAPMIRAILAGIKTQTRRVVKRVPALGEPGEWCHKADRAQFAEMVGDYRRFCPYGQPGDRLWVRETWMDLHGTGVEHYDSAGRMQRFAYGADTRPGSHGDGVRKDYGLKWRPSIHMPRWACRITLELTAVRVERLQTIGEASAECEGVETATPPEAAGSRYRQAFATLWDSINAKRGYGWDANPWVWILTFRRAEVKP